MNPSLRRTSAIATFIFEAGMLTYSCFAVTALRIRVSMSAIGSVMFKAFASSFSRALPGWELRDGAARGAPALPARLLDARQLPLQGELTEADPAQREVPDVRARPAAELAAVLRARRVLLRLAVGPDDHRCLRHALCPILRERHAHHLEQPLALFVRLCRRDDVHLHAADTVDLVIVDLREDQLLAHAEAEVPASVERLGGHAVEVADAGQRGVQHAVQELVHPVAAQRDGGA